MNPFLQKTRSLLLSFPVVLLAINLLLKFSLISRGAYHPDTLLMAIEAQKNLETFQLHYLQASGLPLTSILASLFIALSSLFQNPDPVFGVNLMSVILGSVSPVLFYLILRHYFPPPLPHAGAVVLTFKSLFVALSLYGNSHVPSLFFFLLSMLAFTHYIVVRRTFFLLLSCIAFSLMGAARVQDFVILLLPFTLLVLVHAPRPRWRFKNALIYAGGTFLPIITLYIPRLLSPQEGADYPVSYYLGIIIDNITSTSPSMIYDVLKWLILDQTLVGAMLCLVGLLMVTWQRTRWLWLIAAWIVLPTVLLEIIWMRLPRYFLIPSVLTIPLQLVALVKISALPFFRAVSGPTTTRFLGVKLTLLYLNVFVSLFFLLPILQTRHYYDILGDFYRWIGSVTPEGSHILERDHPRFIRYYGNRAVIENPTDLQTVHPEKLIQMHKDILALIEEGTGVYITLSGLHGYTDRVRPVFQRYINTYFDLEYVGAHLVDSWYIGVLDQRLYINRLYRMRLKSPLPPPPEWSCVKASCRLHF